MKPGKQELSLEFKSGGSRIYEEEEGQEGGAGTTRVDHSIHAVSC